MLYRKYKNYAKMFCLGFIVIALMSLLSHFLWLLTCEILQEKRLLKSLDDVPFIRQSDTAVEFVNYFREYTYDDANTYNGPIYASWPPSQNRSVEHYMNYDFTYQPPNNSIVNKTVLLMVQSLPNEKDYRHTWRIANYLQSQKNVAIVFIMGKEKKSTPKIEKDVLDDMFPKYMLKVDMDVLVNFKNLLHLLSEDVGVLRNDFLLVGRCLCCGGNSNTYCRRIAVNGSEYGNKTKTKWQIPSYLYNQSKYPSYLQGPGYLMSRKSAECILNHSKEIPYFPMEDIFITGFVAQKCNIKRQHSSKFSKISATKLDYKEHIAYHLDCGAIDGPNGKQEKAKCHNRFKLFSYKCRHKLT